MDYIISIIKEFAERTLSGSELEKINPLISADSLYVSDGYKTSPGKANLHKIRSTSETAYQRAIFLQEESKLIFENNHTENVRWMDLELPVTFSENSRRRCVDLVGTIDDTPFICELKFMKKGKSTGDSPLYGVLELVIYYYFVTKFNSALENHKVHHQNSEVTKFDWKDLLKTEHLIFAANEDYWNYWLEHRKYSDKLKEFKNLMNTLDSRYRIPRIGLFNIAPNYDFDKLKDQSNITDKEGNKVYSPRVNNTFQWVEVKIL